MHRTTPRHRAPDNRPGRVWERARRRALAMVCAAAMIAVGLPTTAAATQHAPSPHVNAGIRKVFDGTGHDSPATSTFIRSENGYAPADDTPSDGVVASGDTVGYEVTLAFRAAPARKVRVSLNIPGHLVWEGNKDGFASDGMIVKASREGNDVVFDVGAGKVETLTRVIVLTAKDTGGLTVTDQKLTMDVSIDGQGAYSRATAGAVTVVSAPLADLIICPREVQKGSDGVHRCTRTFPYAGRGEARGAFTIAPNPLRVAGYSTKGVSTAGEWRGTVDVSSFPVGTTWRLDGTTVVPVDGRVAVSGAGVKQLTFALPDTTGDGRPDWPATRRDGTPIGEEEYDTVAYPVHLDVDPSSFSAPGGILNNGDGSQPGGGQDQSFDTYDADTGAVRGTGYRNNDWTLAQVEFAPPVRGSVYGKSLYAPSTPGATWFDPGMTVFDAATGSRNLATVAHSSVAPGTQLEARLTYYAGNAVPLPEDGSLLVLADTWDPAEQHVDGSRPVQLTGPTGQAMEPVRVEWTRTRTLADAADPADRSGWSTSAVVPADATGVRVVFAFDASQPAGTYTATLPFVVNDLGSFQPEQDGTAIDDIGSGGYHARGYLVLPQPHGLRLQQSAKTPAAQVIPGDKVTWTATPTVTNMYLSDETFVPTVTVTLDRYLLNPVNLRPDVWDMTCTPRQGDQLAQCVFTAKQPLTATPKSGSSDGTLPPVVYETTVSRLANGLYVEQLTNAVTVEVEGIEGSVPADPNPPLTVLAQSGVMHDLTLSAAKVETGDSFTVTLVMAGQTGQSLDRMLVLPNTDPEVARVMRAAADADADNPDTPEVEKFTYPGPDASDFSGSYVVTDFEVDDGDSTTGSVVLEYLTVPVTSLHPEDYSAWQPHAGGPLPADATAVRVRLSALGDPQVNAATVHLTFDTDRNAVGDSYVVWASRTHEQDGAGATKNWPVHADVVDSSITGTVWWDEDDDTKHGSSEPGIPGVKVTLHSVNEDGTLGEELKETVTTDDGTYTFDGLHSGRYVTRVHAFDANGDPVAPFSRFVDLYGIERDPQQTYAYLNKLRDSASQESTVIELGVDADQQDVSFGFHAADPRVTVDKTVESLRPNGDGTYTIDWRVTVANTGTTPLDGATLTDRVDDDVMGVTTISGVPVQWKDVVLSGSTTEDATTYAIDTEDRLWAWGYNRSGQVGDGTTTDRATPVLISGQFGGLGTVAQIVVGGARFSTVYVVDTEAQLWAWGYSARGGAGTGSTANQLVPFKVSGTGGLGTVAKDADGRYQVVTAGANHTLSGTIGSAAYATVYVVDDAGSLWAWGDNADGQVADGTVAHRMSPYRITQIPGVTQIVTSGASTFAVDDAGNVWAWGSNDYGQVGNGNRGANVLAPFQVPGITGAHQLTTTRGTSTSVTVYVIDQSGDLWAWGANGSLQTATTGTQFVPAPHNISAATTLGKVSRVVTGGTGGQDTAYAVDTSGALWAWGEGGWGQVGNNSNSDTAVPHKLTGVGTVSAIVTAGYGSTVTAYAISTNGDLYAWGTNSYGQTGTGTTASVNTPRRVDTVGRVRDVVSLRNTAYAIDTNGWVWAWGDNAAGLVGNGSTGAQPTPVRLHDIGRARSVVTNGHTTLALTQSAELWGWGGNTEGALGHATAYVPVPQPVAVSVRDVVTSGRVTAAIDTSGNLWAWGDNSNGAVGIGSTSPATVATPYLVSNGANRPVAPVKSVHLSGGAGYAIAVLAIDANGDLWGWGRQPMSGATGNVGVPTKVTGTGATSDKLGKVEKVVSQHLGVHSAGMTYAIDEDGSVWSWGSGPAAAFGTSDGVTVNGASSTATSPVKVSGPADVVDVVMGSASSSQGDVTVYALERDGDLWAWGTNTAGQVGNGTTTVQPTPFKVTGAGVTAETLGPVARVFTEWREQSAATVYAVETDGDLWAWGANSLGQVGVGSSSTNVTAPAKVTGQGTGVVTLGSVREVVPTNQTVFVIDTGGNLWSWGSDSGNRLGNGTAGNSNVPFRVSGTGLGTVEQVVATVPRNGNLVTVYAIDTDGHLWAWGDDTLGSVGNGGGADQVDEPFDLTAADNGLGTVRTVVASGFQSGTTAYAVDSNGVLWSWGNNYDGVVGDGTIADRFAPYRNERIRGAVADVVASSSANGPDMKYRPVYAIGADGQLWAWGDNTYGQVANGATARVPVPAPVLRMHGDPARVTPVGETSGTGYQELVYDVPDLRPGETRDFLVTGTVRQPVSEAGPLCVVNQAWFDSDQTPITGLLTTPDTTPAWSDDLDPCGQETVDRFNESAQQNQADALEGKDGSDPKWNSFDEVASFIPELPGGQTARLGSISGVVWQDDGDGIRAVGEPLSTGVKGTLYRGEHIYGETVTDGNGAYRFTDLPSDGSYRVVFGPPVLDAGKQHVWTQQDVGEDDTVDSDVDPATSEAGPLTVAAERETTADAGYVVFGPELDTRAGIEGGERTPLVTGPTGECRFSADGAVTEPCDPMVLSATRDGGTRATTFPVVVTNTGTETLRELVLGLTGSHQVTETELTLTTADGTAVTFTRGDDGVYRAPADTVLDPQATLTGRATLTAGIPDGTKVDVTLTASGRGVSSGARVQDEDPWNADVKLAQLTVTKTAYRTDLAGMPPAAPGGTYPEGSILFCYVVKNTGEVPLTGIDLVDIAMPGRDDEEQVFHSGSPVNLVPGQSEEFCQPRDGS